MEIYDTLLHLDTSQSKLDLSDHIWNCSGPPWDRISARCGSSLHILATFEKAQQFERSSYSTSSGCVKMPSKRQRENKLKNVTQLLNHASKKHLIQAQSNWMQLFRQCFQVKICVNIKYMGYVKSTNIQQYT